MNKDIAPAMDEIRAILKKHDMVGLFIVGNRTHCDYELRVESSWSCAWLEKDGEKVLLRVKAKREDFPSREAQKQCLEQTVGAFVTFQHVLTKLDEQLDTVLMMISKHVLFLGKSTDET